MTEPPLPAIRLRRERLLLAPPAGHRWWKSHAQAPTVLVLGEELWRVFFAARDADNRSHILYADFDPSRDLASIRVPSEPILELGPPGSFDSAGMGPSAALFVGDRIFLYYVGMSLRRDVPHQTAIGLAISEDGGGSFRRAAPGPVLGVGAFEPYSTMWPHVAHGDGAYRMYYASAVSWEREGAGWPRYQIRCAHSPDGVSWISEDRVAIAPASESEAAVTRPWVVNQVGRFGMWFCSRGWPGEDGLPAPPYRLSYAQSGDGLVWQRHDELLTFANPPQAGDWDFEMQAYPCAVTEGGERLLFYNGNGFGRSGFGFARILG